MKPQERPCFTGLGAGQSILLGSVPILPSIRVCDINMKSFKFFWTTHKWTGIILSSIFAVTSVTGFMLLLEKRVAWIQPTTLEGAAGGIESFITNQKLFMIVLSLDHPEFQSLEDIDRVDFRPNKRIFKVRSKTFYEIQVDAVTGDVLNVSYRRSDFIETLHDGSFFAQWFHDWVMPVAACGLLFLLSSGLYLWLEPKLRRRRRQRGAATT